jgi:hypothetical protein
MPAYVHNDFGNFESTSKHLVILNKVPQPLSAASFWWGEYGQWFHALFDFLLQDLGTLYTCIPTVITSGGLYRIPYGAVSARKPSKAFAASFLCFKKYTKLWKLKPE